MTTQDRLVQTQKLASLGQLTAANRALSIHASAAFDQGTFVFANPRHASRRRASAPVIAWACQPVIAALAVKLSEDTAPSRPSSDAVVASRYRRQVHPANQPAGPRTA